MKSVETYTVTKGGRLNPVLGSRAPLSIPSEAGVEKALSLLTRDKSKVLVVDGGRTSIKGYEIPVKNGEIDLSALYYKNGKPKEGKVARYSLTDKTLGRSTFTEAIRWHVKHGSDNIGAISTSVPGPINYDEQTGIFSQAREMGEISFPEVARVTGMPVGFDNDLKFWGYYVDFILRLYKEGKLPDKSPIIDETIKLLYKGNPQFGGRQIVIAPGGGLNGAIICGDYFVQDQELGHSGLPPASERVSKFINFLRKHYPDRYKKYPTVTCEDGLSARGLVDCLKFVYLEEHKKTQLPEKWEKLIKKYNFEAAKFIADEAKQKNGIAREAFFLYLEIMGAVCASAVTSTGSTGGVWLGGSVRNDYDFIDENRAEFDMGYRGSRFMAQANYYPDVRVIMDERAPNIGGASLVIGSLQNVLPQAK